MATTPSPVCSALCQQPAATSYVCAVSSSARMLSMVGRKISGEAFSGSWFFATIAEHLELFSSAKGILGYRFCATSSSAELPQVPTLSVKPRAGLSSPFVLSLIMVSKARNDCSLVEGNQYPTLEHSLTKVWQQQKRSILQMT